MQLRRPGSGQSEDLGPKRPSWGSGTSTTKTSTVLVVGGDESVRETTTELLRASGYRVLEATDAVEGLVHLLKDYADLIILDLQMPRLDGKSFLERCTSPAPVIVVSSVGESIGDDLTARFGSRILACMTKPVSPQRLLAMVANATRTKLR